MSLKTKKILITGSNGFIGKNLLQKLLEIGCENIKTYNRENNTARLSITLQLKFKLENN